MHRVYGYIFKYVYIYIYVCIYTLKKEDTYKIDMLVKSGEIWICFFCSCGDVQVVSDLGLLFIQM